MDTLATLFIVFMKILAPLCEGSMNRVPMAFTLPLKHAMRVVVDFYKIYLGRRLILKL